ncbi:MAG: NAD-dependent epimerase/dehydratase family protein, partial [Bdellovibrionales bacterium]|nr:NAD-dependent epimerase/dehydratase family protein [Bdellovibrionales bacterium]
MVTGATGFTGSHLTRRLLELGHDVSCLVRPTSDPALVEEFRSKGATIITGDVTDRDCVFQAVAGNDYVFHIAALFRQAKFPDQIYWDVNVGGTVNVLDAAEAAGVEKMVHCSTGGVHSHIDNPPADESTPYRPSDIYQVTKCEAEKLALERFRSGRLRGTVIRPAMIWGEGDRRILK